MPVFPGGEEALMQAVRSKIKDPEIAYENGIEGRVVCSFVINEAGNCKSGKRCGCFIE